MPFSFQDIISKEGNQTHRTSVYHHVNLNDEEQEEGLLEKEDDELPKLHKKSVLSRFSRFSLPVSILLFVLSTANVVFSIYHRPTDQQCVAQTSLWCTSMVSSLIVSWKCL
jgi:hypothetical protein